MALMWTALMRCYDIIVVCVCFCEEKSLEKLWEQSHITLLKNCFIISQCQFAHSIWSYNFLALPKKERNYKTFPHRINGDKHQILSLLAGSNLRSCIKVASYL